VGWTDIVSVDFKCPVEVETYHASKPPSGYELRAVPRPDQPRATPTARNRSPSTTGLEDPRRGSSDVSPIVTLSAGVSSPETALVHVGTSSMFSELMRNAGEKSLKTRCGCSDEVWLAGRRRVSIKDCVSRLTGERRGEDEEKGAWLSSTSSPHVATSLPWACRLPAGERERVECRGSCWTM
jgi:hypothetical protein